MSAPPVSEPPSDQAAPDSLTARYLRAVGDEIGSGELTPAALARALVRVLPVEAAGLALLVEPLRLPLGASDVDAHHAEQLQTTLGEGPCLDAAQHRTAVVADQAELGTRWPLYAEELTKLTPFRSVAAIPLVVPTVGVIAALDLFSTRPDLRERLDLPQAERLARSTAALLATCLDEVSDVSTPEDGPEWYREATGRRHDVWLAIGMVMSRRTAVARDALDLLRGHAFSHSCSLDDLAAELVTGRLPIDGVTG